MIEELGFRASRATFFVETPGKDSLQMNLRRWATLSSLLLLSSIGCCHSRCVSSDPCDPCGPAPTCGRYVSGWMGHKIQSWRMRNYGWGCGGCDSCSCGNGGEMFASGCDSGNCASGNCGGVVMGGSPTGCACGQQHSEYAPSVPGVPSQMTAPVPHSYGPTPAPVVAPPQVPMDKAPIDNEVGPPPADANTTRRSSSGPQHVSVEEFHRLPGVVVSGSMSQSPQSSVPSLSSSVNATQPLLAAPQLSSVPAPPRVVSSGAQQVNWVPSKQ